MIYKIVVMKRMILIFALISTSFMLSQEPIIEAPKIVIKLPINETLQLNIGSVTFLEVLEDSRCPKEVTCIWAGRAKIRVAIQENGQESYLKEIIFGELLDGETTSSVLFSTENHIVYTIDLYPIPSSETKEEYKSFELLVQIRNK